MSYANGRHATTGRAPRRWVWRAPARLGTMAASLVLALGLAVAATPVLDAFAAPVAEAADAVSGGAEGGGAVGPGTGSGGVTDPGAEGGSAVDPGAEGGGTTEPEPDEAPIEIKIKMSQPAVGKDGETDLFGTPGLTATVALEGEMEGAELVVNGAQVRAEPTSQGAETTLACDGLTGIEVVVTDAQGRTVAYAYGEDEATTDVDGTVLTGHSFEVDASAPPLIGYTLSGDKNEGAHGNYFIGDVTATLTFSTEAERGLGLLEGLDDGWTLVAEQDDGRAATYAKVFSAGDEGAHAVSVLARNRGWFEAGARQSFEFVIDKTAPSASIAFDNNNSQNGRHYAAGRTATVTIEDVSFDERTATVTCNGEPVDARWEHDGALHTATVLCGAEGSYELAVFGKDLAGNAYRAAAEEFVVDKTPPAIDVAFDNNSAADGRYYDRGRTATVTVREAHFDAGLVAIEGGRFDGSWETDSADPLAHTARVSFDADGEHRLAVGACDLAGNRAEGFDSGAFVVDSTAPELLLSFADNNAAADKDGQVAYYAAQRSATIRVVEQNFSEERFELDCKNDAAQAGTWRHNGNVHELDVRFPESADVYELAARLTDRAGNGCEPVASGGFVVDTTDPEVFFELSVEKANTCEGVDYFDRAPVVTLSVVDANFRPGESPISVVGGTVLQAWERAADAEGRVAPVWRARVALTEGAGRSVEVVARDWAGRSQTLRYGDAVVDMTAPEVTAASLGEKPSGSYGDEYCFFDREMLLRVAVSDGLGLGSVAVADGAGGYYDQAAELEPGVTEHELTLVLADGHGVDRDVVVTATDLAGNRRSWSIAPTGEVAAANEADLGNVSALGDGGHPQLLLRDTVAPRLALEGVEAGAYYNRSQQVVLSVDELNLPYVREYDADQAILTVARTEGAAAGARSSWQVPAGRLVVTQEGGLAFADAKGTYAYDGYGLVEELAEDGHYTVEAQLTDPAGNRGAAVVGEFTIDATPPVCDVSFDNNEAQNGRYYKAARRATVTVTEHNFDPALIAVETNGAVGAWSSEGDTHSVEVVFATDGVCYLLVTGADKAGNALAPYEADEFVVDLTAPTVTFGGVEDASAYNAAVAPVAVFEDEANFDADAVRYTLVGSKNGEVSYPATVTREEGRTTVAYADFAREADVDDVYTLRAQAADLAGNTSEASVTFSVNRFGSTFYVVDAESYTQGGGYLAAPKDVLIEEINVSGVALGQHAVVVTEGADVSALELCESAGDTGYTVEQGTSSDPGSNGWAAYTYRVAAGNFAKDGRYHVAVQSRDRAQNANTSTGYYDRAARGEAVAEVSFVLDTTDPVVTGLSVHDGQTYEAGVYQGSFGVVENIGIADVSVFLDGEKIDVAETGYGTYAFEVAAKPYSERSLEVVAKDLAGRTARVSVDGFRVTADVFELHLPRVVACAVALGLAAVAVAALVVRRRHGRPLAR